MTEQNRTGESRGFADQEYCPQHPITKKLSGMHADTQELLQEESGARNR